MKKLLIKYTRILSLVFFVLMFSIHYAHSQNIDELFGIKLFDNATNYVSSEFIEINKFKHRETISGFSVLYLGDKASSTYFDDIYIIIDDYNIIHAVQGDKEYHSIDRCVTFLEKLVSKIETRKQIEFAFEERDYGTFLIKRYTTWENDTSVNVQCNEDFDPIRNLMIHFIRSNELIGAINEYYDND